MHLFLRIFVGKWFVFGSLLSRIHSVLSDRWHSFIVSHRFDGMSFSEFEQYRFGARHTNLSSLSFWKAAAIYALAICYDELVSFRIKSMLFSRSGYCIHMTCDDIFLTEFFFQYLLCLFCLIFLLIIIFFVFFSILFQFW